MNQHENLPKPAPAPRLNAHPMMHPTATAKVANTAFSTMRFIGRTPTISKFRLCKNFLKMKNFLLAVFKMKLPKWD